MGLAQKLVLGPVVPTATRWRHRPAVSSACRRRLPFLRAFGCVSMLARNIAGAGGIYPGPRWIHSPIRSQFLACWVLVPELGSGCSSSSSRWGIGIALGVLLSLRLIMVRMEAFNLALNKLSQVSTLCSALG